MALRLSAWATAKVYPYQLREDPPVMAGRAHFRNTKGK